VTNKKTIITVICCMCGKYLGEKDGEGVSGVSHGYCETCKSIKIQKDKEILKRLKEEERNK